MQNDISRRALVRLLSCHILLFFTNCFLIIYDILFSQFFYLSRNNNRLFSMCRRISKHDTYHAKLDTTHPWNKNLISADGFCTLESSTRSRLTFPFSKILNALCWGILFQRVYTDVNPLPMVLCARARGLPAGIVILFQFTSRKPSINEYELCTFLPFIAAVKFSIPCLQVSVLYLMHLSFYASLSMC